jgi:hypothetical protein
VTVPVRVGTASKHWQSPSGSGEGTANFHRRVMKIPHLRAEWGWRLKPLAAAGLRAGGRHVRRSGLPEATLLDPQLHEHRAVVGELIPHGCIGLAVRDLAERRAVDPGQDAPVDDDVINKSGKRVVPAGDGHVLCQRGEVGVGRVAVVEIRPHLVMGLGEAAVEVPEHDERQRPCAAASIQPSRTGICSRSIAQAELVEAFSTHPLLRCTDRSWNVWPWCVRSIRAP